MRILSFEWRRLGAPAVEFSRGFQKLSYELASHKKPIWVTLWRDDGTGLHVKPMMFDSGDRTEYGVLEFEPAPRGLAQGVTVALPQAFAGVTRASKLVLKSDGFIVESGVSIKGDGGAEIVLIAGAYPYTLALSFGSVLVSFEPEYPVDQYTREPIV
jgi:hypothetical protein